MPLCDHEEADTRMLVHLQDALDNGATSCLVRMVDTDVVVTTISKFHSLLANHPTADIWIAFGTGKNFSYIHINTISTALGKDKSMALSVLLAVTLPPDSLGEGRGQPGNHTQM